MKQPSCLPHKRQSGNLGVAVWNDKRDVRIVSTNSYSMNCAVQRSNGREVVPVPCPMSIISYNANPTAIGPTMTAATKEADRDSHNKDTQTANS